MKLMIVSLTLALVVGCGDRAKDSYEVGLAREKAGDIEGALTAFTRATWADPKSESGRSAAEHGIVLMNTIPTTVTFAWCSRLVEHLRPSFLAQAVQAHPGSSLGFLAENVDGYLKSLEYQCQQALGRSTAGSWSCYWNSRYDTYRECEQLGYREAEARRVGADP